VAQPKAIWFCHDEKVRDLDILFVHLIATLATYRELPSRDILLKTRFCSQKRTSNAEKYL